ncbi:MAG: hypothetical protein ACJ8C4_14050 [Gemmataceae bacterium]
MFLLASPSQASASVLYNITDIGTLGGPECRARAINNFGQVTGDSQYSPGNYHAFIYSNASMTDLGNLPGSGTNSYGRGINDVGQVTGVAGSGSTTKSFIYSNGQMTSLGTLGGTFCSAEAINNSGVITGGSFYSGLNSSHVFSYATGVMTDFGSPTSGSAGGFTINNFGQIVAQSNGLTYLRVGSGWQSIGTFGGSTTVGEINDTGTIVGISTYPDSHTRPYIFVNGQMTDIGNLGGVSSGARGVNSTGQVVGFSSLLTGVQAHAFLYQNGQMSDLNDVIPTGSGYVLNDAWDINDFGQIICQATNPAFGGFTHSVLLTPVPEPTSLFLLALPGLWAARVARIFRRKVMVSGTKARGTIQ